MKHQRINLNGKWKILVISGLWWFRLLNKLKNIKIISGHSGYNVAKRVDWGHFDIKFLLCSNITLKYKYIPVIDNLTIITDDLLKGEFYWAGKFIGKFDMIRIKRDSLV